MLRDPQMLRWDRCGNSDSERQKAQSSQSDSRDKSPCKEAPERRRDPCLWLVLTLTGVWSKDDSSEVKAQSIWGVVVGVTASQLSSLGSGTP